MIREAVQIALEALEDANDVARMEFGDEDYYSEAINALRKALETEQEPVLWLKTWSDGSVSVLKTKSPSFADHELEPLYTVPPKREWVGLTDGEMEALFLNEDGVRFARYIESRLKDKNA